MIDQEYEEMISKAIQDLEDLHKIVHGKSMSQDAENNTEASFRIASTPMPNPQHDSMHYAKKAAEYALWGCLFCLLAVLLSACSGESEDPAVITEIEICIDQGGEWQGECTFANEYCAIRVQCKPNAEFCPCDVWGIKE